MKKNLVVSLILILVVCSFPSKIFAEELNDLYTKQNDLKNQQSDATTALEAVQSQLTSTLQQIQDLNSNIINYQTEISGLDEKIISLQNSIKDIEGKLAIAQESYDKQKKLLDERLVAIYEAGQTNYLDVILKSNGISDFISSYYLISELAQYDTDFLEEIESQKRNIENNKEALEKQKKEFNLIKANKEKTAIILRNTMTIKDSYMAQLSEQEQEIQNQIDTYQAQLNEIEAEIMQITMANIDSKYIGGVMEWPVPGYTRITSTYRMRVHPITGVYKLHTGIDIGAPRGSNFIAANDGIVTKAGWNAAYGNMVMIDHGGGIATLYAHGDEIIATLGQVVKKGDVILKVGSTGYSTGPHAHFEVRVNGSPVDPLPYITNNEQSSEDSNTIPNTGGTTTNSQ